jgi:hypothetical protein
VSIEDSESQLLDNHMKWVLTEYIELRKEIYKRSREQFWCISGSAIGIVSAAGLILEPTSADKILSAGLPLYILLAVSWFLPVFGMIWANHAYKISFMAAYIKTRLETRINGFKPKSCEEIGWQNWKDNHHGPKSHYVFSLPLSVFIIPSVCCNIAWIMLINENNAKSASSFELVFGIIGLLLMAMLIRAWIILVRFKSNKE